MWNFFSSISLSVVILISLAITSITGTLIPQNENLESYVQIFGQSLTKILFDFGFFDIYHSFLYQSLLFLLLLNIIICSLSRIPFVLKIVFNEKNIFHPAKFKSAKIKQSFIINQNLINCQDKIKSIILSFYKDFIFETKESGFYIFAEKGRFARFGAYVVHLSILFMIAGGIVGSIWGFEAYVNLPEGETISEVFHINGKQTVKLNFSIRCDDFAVSFYETGQPKEYKSDLTILENEKEFLKQSIVVNSPLRYKGINIFQSSYGKIPVEDYSSEPPEIVKLYLKNTQTGMIYMISGNFNKEINLPEGIGKVIIKDYLQSSEYHGYDLGPTIMIKIKYNDLNENESEENNDIFIPIKYSTFDKMRNGYFQISVANPEDFKKSSTSEIKYYTGLQITKDPGVWFVYTGFIIMLIGIYITFFTSHDRIFIEVLENKSINFFIAATTSKNKLAMQKKIDNICKKIKELID